MKKLSAESLALVCLLVYCLAKTEFFFFGLESGISQNARAGLGVVALLFACVLKPPRFRWWIALAYVGVAIVTYAGKFRHTHEYSSVQLLYPNYLDGFVCLSLLLDLGLENFKRLFRWYRNTIVLLALPALVVYACIFVGMELPYTMIALHGRGEFTRCYFGFIVFLNYTMYSAGPFTVARLCGPFEEPGLLGTLLAFLVTADYLLFPLRTGWRRMMIACGLLTLSLAFFVQMTFLCIYALASGKKQRLLITSLVGLVALSLVYFSLPAGLQAVVYDNVVFRIGYNFEQRQFNDTSRTGYHERFLEYWSQAGPEQKLIGNGYGANVDPEKNGGYNTIHALLYEFGFGGVTPIALLLVFYYLWLPFWRKQWLLIIIGAACLSSFYQRYDVFSVKNWFVIRAVVVRLRGNKGPETEAHPGVRGREKSAGKLTDTGGEVAVQN